MEKKLPLLYDGSYIEDYYRSFRWVMDVPESVALLLIAETYDCEPSRFMNKNFVAIPRQPWDTEFLTYTSWKLDVPDTANNYLNRVTEMPEGVMVITRRDDYWRIYQRVNKE